MHTLAYEKSGGETTLMYQVTTMIIDIPSWGWALIGAGAVALLFLFARYAWPPLSSGCIALLRIIYRALGGKKIITDDIAEAINAAGFAYDARQDIFYSLRNPWQREFGYSRLYDEAAAPLGMIIDSEPIYFEYDNKRWLIEVWKGQYGMTVGGEVGVYTAPLSIVPKEMTLYMAKDESDELEMAFRLYKDGKPLFVRQDVHWWLTGFILGEFSDPDDLEMDVQITFKDMDMCRAFVRALLQLGYTTRDVRVRRTTVQFRFDRPFTPAPITRTNITDRITLARSKSFCDLYHQITDDTGGTTIERLVALRDRDPELFSRAIQIGRPASMYKQPKT